MNLIPSIELKILDPRIYEWGLPKHQTDMAAAIDLFACNNEPIRISPSDASILIPSGIAIHINDPNIAALLLPRSGDGHKRGLVLGNLVGLIDPDYTGPLMISVWNRNTYKDVVVRPGERIAQMLFVPIVRPQFQIVEEFSATSKRGVEGFGSTGD